MSIPSQNQSTLPLRYKVGDVVMVRKWCNLGTVTGRDPEQRIYAVTRLRATMARNSERPHCRYFYEEELSYFVLSFVGPIAKE